MRSIRKSTVLEAAAIVGPLAAFIAARAILAPGPESAGAQPVQPAAAPAVARPAPIRLTREQERALAWIRSAGGRRDLASPMDHPRAVLPETPEAEGTEDPAGGLRLTGVLGNGDAALATISGKIYRIGDEVRPGVRLRAVDVRGGAVELELADGSVARLVRESP